MSEPSTMTDPTGGMPPSGGTAVATEFPDDIRAIGDAMVKLSAQQCRDTRSYLLDEYGIETPKTASDYEQKSIITDEAEPPQTIFDVILKAFPAEKKIGIIKIVRAQTGLGLAESKAFVEGALPKLVKEALPLPDAEKLKKELEEAGASVELK